MYWKLVSSSKLKCNTRLKPIPFVHLFAELFVLGNPFTLNPIIKFSGYKMFYTLTLQLNRIGTQRDAMIWFREYQLPRLHPKTINCTE